MALSVKRLIHGTTCEEPANEVSVYYSSSTSDLCSGNGTLTSIFTDGSNVALSDIYSDNDPVTGADGNICGKMDVVFAIEYTANMAAGAIPGIQSGIQTIIDQIVTETSGDYRLGLVVFDGSTTSSSPNYASSYFYQTLPSAQKLNYGNSAGGGGQTFITALELMDDLGNATTFTNKLNVLNQPNGLNGMAIGNNVVTGGQALYEISEGFAGSWRGDAQRVIICIADEDAVESSTYFSNTVFPEVDSNQVQVHVVAKDSLASTPNYSSIALGTTPVGSMTNGTNYGSSEWINTLTTVIADSCDETFIYNCNSATAGWYQVPGEYTLYYWDGSAWTNTHTCQYTMTINLVDNITNGGLTSITSEHPNYSTATQFQVTGDHGSAFDITWTVVPDDDHTLDNITNGSVISVSGSGVLVMFTDGGENTPSLDASLASNEFKLSGTILGDATKNVVVTASADANVSAMTLDIICDETDGPNYGNFDNLDAEGATQSPTGRLDILSTQTPATGWTDVGSTYYRSSRRYVFSGITGSQHTFDVNFQPNPSDYDLTLVSTTLAGTIAGTTALSGNYTLNNTNDDITGTFSMPRGGGNAQITVYAQVNQPDYQFTLTATESITGASITGAPWSQTFSGYTGDEFTATINLSLDADYSSFTINDVLNITGENAAAVSYSVNNETGSVDVTVTMPEGGGIAEVPITGTSVQQRHTYTITFEDPYTDTAEWQTITYNGITGSFHATTHPLSFKDPDTNYYITEVSNDNPSNLVSTDDNTVDQELNIVLASMPDGGGSAIVTVLGSQSSVQYSYTTTFSLAGSTGTNFTNNNSSQFYNVVTTGSAGDQFTIEAQVETPIDYEWTSGLAPSISESSTALSEGSATNANTYTSNIQVTLTMPSGGGSGTVTVTPNIRPAIYTYTATVQTNTSTTSVNQYSEALVPSNANSVSGVNNSNGTVTITYSGPVGTTWNNIQVAVVSNNSVDYSPEITGTAVPSGVFSLTENEYGGEGVDIDCVMPSLDPRSASVGNTIVLTVTESAVIHSFTISHSDNISNVSPAIFGQSFTGAANSEHSFSIAYSATSGYSYNITGATLTGSNTSALSALPAPGGQSIQGTLIMPSGGGSATVTANGTSTQIAYFATITWSNSVSNATWDSNGTNTVQQTVSLPPGSSTSIMQTLNPASGREIVTLSASDNSSNVAVTEANEGTGTIQATVNMPSNATGDFTATITATGTTRIITKSLTVNYAESVTGAYITSGSGAGAAEDSGTVHTGAPGTTGNVTRYFLPESGYSSASISSMSDNSTYIYGLSSGSGAGAGQAWYYTYEIPPVDSTGTITINGSGVQNCTCNFLGITSNPSTYGGSNGSITITVQDSCIPGYSWTLNGESNTPTQTRPLEFEYTGLSAGTYNVTLTDSNGCVWTTLFAIQNPTTTTSAPTYYYYLANLCDTGNQVRLRGTSSYALSSFVGTSYSGGSGSGSGSGAACLTSEVLGSSYDYTITGYTIADAECDCGGFGGPEGIE